MLVLRPYNIQGMPETMFGRILLFMCLFHVLGEARIAQLKVNGSGQTSSRNLIESAHQPFVD